MATTPKKLIPGSLLTTSAVAYYTAGASTKAIIQDATVSNTSGGAVTVTVYLVPSAGSASAANTIIPSITLAANEVQKLWQLVPHVVEAGGTIQALSNTGAAVSFQASGVEVTG